jgi:hypothetical protein
MMIEVVEKEGEERGGKKENNAASVRQRLKIGSNGGVQFLGTWTGGARKEKRRYRSLFLFVSRLSRGRDVTA